jgi:SET domain-containing protein
VKKSGKYRLEIRESPIHGHGVFAGEDIPWGKKIKKYGGEVISDKKAAKRLKRGAAAIMEIGKGLNIDGFRKGNGAGFINHNRKTPNCFLLREKGSVWIVSGVEGIKAGEELTFDYGSDYYPRPRRKRA